MALRIVFNPKLSGSIVNLQFPFLSSLVTNETITGTPTVTCAVWTGIDPNPSAMISGTASVVGTSVQQAITGGVVGVVYQLTCICTTSAGQTLQSTGYLLVEAVVP